MVLEMRGGIGDEKVKERLLAADGEDKKIRNRGMAGFLQFFGPNFLHAQAMKSITIYRRWMRVILST